MAHRQNEFVTPKITPAQIDRIVLDAQRLRSQYTTGLIRAAVAWLTRRPAVKLGGQKTVRHA